jgi:hypothetical protein
VILYSLSIDEIKPAIFLPDARMMQDLGEFFRLGIPGAVMMMMESYAYALVVIIAGWLEKKNNDEYI